MQISILSRAFVSISLLLCAFNAQASNFNFLKDTPISYMTERDVNSLLGVVKSALDTTQDGKALYWTNQDLRNSVAISATVTPGQLTHRNHQICRTVGVELKAKGQTMEFHPRYCKTEHGQWQYQKQ